MRLGSVADVCAGRFMAVVAEMMTVGPTVALDLHDGAGGEW